ncbi:MAG: outer membrane lipoprotein carrier protein LolA [Candidatus Firestonebacteria bacterium]
MTKQTKSLKWLIYYLFFISSSYALNVDEVINNLTESMKNKMNSFEADVEQVICISDMEDPQKMKGNITFKKPGMMCLDYTEPNKQFVISDGKTIWIYFPAMRQVIVQDISEVKNKEYFLFQFDLFIDSIKSRFETKLLKEEKMENKETVLVEFIPRDEHSEFSKISGLFDKEKWLPIHLSVYYNELSNISITFKNFKLNSEVKTDIFDFKIPEGVEVISSLLK